MIRRKRCTTIRITLELVPPPVPQASLTITHTRIEGLIALSSRMMSATTTMSIMTSIEVEGPTSAQSLDIVHMTTVGRLGRMLMSSGRRPQLASQAVILMAKSNTRSRSSTNLMSSLTSSVRLPSKELQETIRAGQT